MVEHIKLRKFNCQALERVYFVKWKKWIFGGGGMGPLNRVKPLLYPPDSNLGPMVKLPLFPIERLINGLQNRPASAGCNENSRST
jgi:hypothetical protein